MAIVFGPRKSTIPTPSYSFLLDGVDERIKTANSAVSISATNGFSVAIWFKVVDTVEDSQHLFSKYAAAISFNIRYNGTAGSRTAVFYYLDGLGATKACGTSTAGALEDGEWHFLVCQSPCLGGALEQVVYLDGILDGQVTPNNSGYTDYTAGSSNVSIGGRSNAAGAFFGGNVTQAMIFTDRVLTPTEITTLYNSGVPASDSVVDSISPDHHWKLGDDATWDGSNWTCPDRIGSADMTSTNVEEGDRIQDAP